MAMYRLLRMPNRTIIPVSGSCVSRQRLKRGSSPHFFSTVDTWDLICLDFRSKYCASLFGLVIFVFLLVAQYLAFDFVKPSLHLIVGPRGWVLGVECLSLKIQD